MNNTLSASPYRVQTRYMYLLHSILIANHLSQIGSYGSGNTLAGSNSPSSLRALFTQSHHGNHFITIINMKCVIIKNLKTLTNESEEMTLGGNFLTHDLSWRKCLLRDWS